MKHLKLFESIDLPYTRITYSECINLRWRSEKFTIKELSELTIFATRMDLTLVEDVDYLSYPVVLLLTRDGLETYDSKKFKQKPYGNRIDQVVIHKVEDEWFLIGEVCHIPEQLILKCDQMT